MKRATAVLATLALLATPLAAAAKGKARKSVKPDGAALFSENCAYCHGAGGRGDGPNAEHLTPRPADLTRSRASETEIAGVVRDGKGSCPSWRASLTDEEIAAVARWAGTLRP